jgi:hypothetical protein
VHCQLLFILGKKITIETKATNALRTNALVHTFRLTHRFRHVEQNVAITLRAPAGTPIVRTRVPRCILPLRRFNQSVPYAFLAGIVDLDPPYRSMTVLINIARPVFTRF